MTTKERPRVLIDLDGVVVDFASFMQKNGMTSAEVKKLPGAYLSMPAMPGALDAVRSIIGAGYEVWIATKPPTGVPYAYSDKAAWVMNYLPELKRRIIVTHHKGMLGRPGDILIDDRPHKAFCGEFQGTVLQFSSTFGWPEVLAALGIGTGQGLQEGSERVIAPKALLEYSLIKTKRRLTFDILSQDLGTIHKGDDDGDYPKFTASNGYEVISRSRMDIQTERIWLLGAMHKKEARSGTMVFSDDKKRDAAYDNFVQALNEWAAALGGVAVQVAP